MLRCPFMRWTKSQTSSLRRVCMIDIVLTWHNEVSDEFVKTSLHGRHRLNLTQRGLSSLRRVCMVDIVSTWHNEVSDEFVKTSLHGRHRLNLTQRGLSSLRRVCMVDIVSTWRNEGSAASSRARGSAAPGSFIVQFSTYAAWLTLLAAAAAARAARVSLRRS